MSNHLDHCLQHADFDLGADHGLEWALGDSTVRGTGKAVVAARVSPVKAAFAHFPAHDNTSDITGRWRPQWTDDAASAA